MELLRRKRKGKKEKKCKINFVLTRRYINVRKGKKNKIKRGREEKKQNGRQK